MAFRLWSSKPNAPHPPPLVALNPSASQQAALTAAAEAARIPFTTSLPPSGDYILALPSTHQRPANLAPHIPVIDPSSPQLHQLIEEALLYLEAHHRLKQ